MNPIQVQGVLQSFLILESYSIQCMPSILCLIVGLRYDLVEISMLKYLMIKWAKDLHNVFIRCFFDAALSWIILMMH